MNHTNTVTISLLEYENLRDIKEKFDEAIHAKEVEYRIESDIDNRIVKSKISIEEFGLFVERRRVHFDKDAINQLTFFPRMVAKWILRK